MAKLAGTPTKTASVTKQNSGGSSSGQKQPENEQRSRLNSLHNGETTKVIQTHNIDVPVMDIDQCTDFALFQKQQAEENKPSRKQSIDEFQKDSSKFDAILNKKSQAKYTKK